LKKLFDIIIVGAGIVGLASALYVKRKYPDSSVAIIEKENEVAKHQTGNNSGVIHSGVYYKPGSLKALNCKRGYDLMLDFVKEYDIPYELCGKIIVAFDESEFTALDNIYKRGNENGLTNLRILDAKEMKEIEPHVAGEKAIHVPQAGITDYKMVSQKYQVLLEELGVHFFFGQKVISLKNQGNTVTIKTRGLQKKKYSPGRFGRVFVLCWIFIFSRQTLACR